MQEQIREELRNGKSVETVCEEYNLTFAQLFNLLDYNKLKYVPKKHAKNISKKRDKYYVTKKIDGEKIYFGQYATLQDAALVRDELKKCNWDKSKLWEIQVKTGIALKGLENTFIYETKRGNWNVTKVIHNKKVSYGTYKTLQEAKQVRDELVKAKWDMDKLDKIVKELNVQRIYRGGQPKGLK